METLTHRWPDKFYSTRISIPACTQWPHSSWNRFVFIHKIKGSDWLVHNYGTKFAYMYKIKLTCYLTIKGVVSISVGCWGAAYMVVRSRHRHWLLTVSHHCLGSNTIRGMWESCQWLGVRQWFYRVLRFPFHIQLASHDLLASIPQNSADNQNNKF